MATRIFVGNLSFDTTRDGLAELFGSVGTVMEISLPQDRETGRTRGFAYVWMATEAEAEGAIERLNGHALGGRPIRVAAAPQGGAPSRGIGGGTLG